MSAIPSLILGDSYPVAASITEIPIEDEINPFVTIIPPEILCHIVERIGDMKTRIAFEKTCKKFQALGTNLYEAARKLTIYILERNLTNEERDNLADRILRMEPDPDLSFILLERAQKEISALPVLDDAMSLSIEDKSKEETQVFYKSFKKRLKEFGLEFPDETSIRFSVMALEYFITEFGKGEVEQSPLIREKNNSLSLEVYNSVLDEIIRNYAVEINAITVASFKEKIRFISRYFTSLPIPNIEAFMRQAIKLRGRPENEQQQRTAEIESMRLQFVDMPEDAPRFKAILQTIKANLEHRQSELEALRLELCGWNGFNGTINEAYQARICAENALHLEKRYYCPALVYNCELLETEIDRYDSSNDLAYEIKDIASLIVGCAERIALLSQELIDAIKVHESRVQSLSVIAQFDHAGEIVGGAHH